MTDIKKLNPDPFYSQRIPSGVQKSEDKKTDSSDRPSLYQRVAFAVLPVIGNLYRPLKMPIICVLGGLRMVSNLSTLCQESQKSSIGTISHQVIQTAVILSSIVGIILAHPTVGMLINSGYDTIFDIVSLAGQLQNGDLLLAMESGLKSINNVVFLGMILAGGLQLTIAALSLQILITLYKSQRDFRNEQWLEGLCNFLMVEARSLQLKNQWQSLQSPAAIL